MKKFTKKLKGKKVLSIVLAAIMIATTFNIALPMLKLDASAATIDGVTQERVVGTDGSYATTYDNYAAAYLNGASSPTNIVIPGLNAAQDYVIQGMTYYPERDWMLITAYHNVADGETVQSSKVFAIDAATGEFVAMFSFLNPDGTANTEHGGGIACSENNIYYACGDDDRQIAYAPISAFETAVEGTHTVVQLVDMVEFNEIGSVTSSDKTAYTAYVCYDDGVLWTGNFYDMGVKILGVSVAATDYSVPANNDYNSMVFGYRLAGNSSAEEWNYLMGNVTGKDCRGNPSYVIGLNNSIKDVQYAVVDNGKLYLSCSFGTGEGTNSVSLGGMNPYSTLVVADIDLTQPGTKSTTINTHNGSKTVMAYDIQNTENFSMMPMSEGLCVIEDKIYITFESASNKYLNEAGTFTGNCNHPIDVVWQLDPYELMETVVAEPEKSIYYEKVYSHADIKDGDEYIIVHESQTKDPVSQKNYLYALNAHGNFKGLELSKSSVDANAIKGYDGMIGHPISYYSFEKGVNGEDILYLEHPEDDDIESIRWTLTKNSTDSSSDKYKIKNTSTYFANYNSLYFNQNKITMAPNEADFLSAMLIGQLEQDSGYFYLSNNGAYYLWCNDGFENYNTKANAYYANNAAAYPLLDGVTEVPGTFHCDALNGSGENILGGQIDTSDDTVLYEDGAFQIYRRVVDEVASTYESRVYTNLDAELQADGTYTITLDTYAISPNHYQYVDERPTDYIIVADTSKTMDITEAKDPNVGSTGINEYNGSLSVASMSNSDDTSDDHDVGVVGYGFYNTDENIHFKHTDGKYYKAYMAIYNVSMTYGSKRQCYYVYYIADDGLYYCVVDHAFQTDSNGNRIGKTYSEFKAWVDSGSDSNCSDYDTSNNNSGRREEDVYVGVHYRFDNINNSYAKEHTSLAALKTTAKDLVDKIAAQNSNNRIALVQYGASNGYYNTSGSLVSSGYTDAFWATGTADQLKAKIDTLSADLETSDSSSMMDLVSNIMSNSGSNYKSGGDRNVAVIFFSDGVPGTETSTRKGNFITGYYYLTETTEASATNVANQVISKAKTIKNNGAFIYTVLLGNVSAGSFSKKTYMDAVSSKYPDAESMTSLGGKSVDGVDYALNIATCSIDGFVDFGSKTSEEVAVNSSVGLDNLDANSYLREVLSDAFKFPENGDYSIETKFVPGEYDEIGRFAFGNATDATGVTTDINTTTKTITVTGYDYSTQYISEGNDGNALRIIITGLLADETAEINNTSINVKEKTGIYKTEAKMNTDEAFKNLPTEYFNIPKYTYVLDYGLQLLDTDVNGTLKAVSAGLTKQDVNNYIKESENGLVAIQEGDQNLLYHNTPTNATDSGYVLIQREDGTYDWFEIEVVPASNVYFEETDIDVKAADKDNAKKLAWTTDGTATTSHRGLPDEDDVDGFENAYNVENQIYSNGTAKKVVVNSTNKNSKTQTFDFVGTGIDIVSRCSDKTGMMLISVKKEVDGKMKTVKSAIVDTYCGKGTFNQTPIFSWSIADTEGATYGTYTVEIGAMYLTSAGAVVNAPKSVKKSNLIDTGLEMNTSTNFDAGVLQAMLDEADVEDVSAKDVELVWFDDNSIFNGGTGVAPTKKGSRADGGSTVNLENYIDGFRVYNPLDPDDEENVDKYKASEKNAVYANVIDNLAKLTPDTTISDGIAFITGSLADGETLNFANYESVGPTGEFYLNGNSQAVSIGLYLAENEKVMLGLRAVNGPTTFTVTSTGGTLIENIKVNSATEMYYDISACLSESYLAENGRITTVTITNTGSNMLAVNHLKLSGAEASSGAIPAPRSIGRSIVASEVSGSKILPITEADLPLIQNSLMQEGVEGVVKNGVVVPVVENEEIIPDDNTTPDDNNTNDDTNNDTNTDSGDADDTFDIFSLLKMLIAFIKEVLFNSVGNGKLL